MIGEGHPAKNTAWLMIHQLVRMGIGLVVSLWLARYLGPAGLGTFSFALSWMLIFSALSSFGLVSISVHAFVESKSDEGTVLATVGILRTLAAGFSLVACLLLFPLLPGSNTQSGSLLLIFCLVIPFRVADVVDSFFLSRIQAKFTVLGRLSAYLLSSGLTVYGILSEQSLVWFAWPLALEFAGTALSYLIVNARYGPPLRALHWSTPLAKSLMKKAWPVIFSTLALMLYERLDILMLSVLRGSREAGLYAAAARITEPLNILAFLLMSTLFPLMAKARRDRPQSYPSKLQQSFDLLLLCSFPIAFGVTIAAPWLIPFLFGEDFAKSIPILSMLVWVTPFIFLRTGLDRWLILENKTIWSLWTHSGILLTNFFLNLWLIPHFGGFGAALSSFLAIFCGGYLFALAIPETRAAGKKMSLAILLPIRFLTGKKITAPWEILFPNRAGK